MAEQRDIVVIGGGIGGAALATVLARAGHAVLVLEKSTVYRDRVRGEWIAPWAGRVPAVRYQHNGGAHRVQCRFGGVRARDRMRIRPCCCR